MVEKVAVAPATDRLEDAKRVHEGEAPARSNERRKRTEAKK